MTLASFRVRVSPSGHEETLVVPDAPRLKYTVGPSWTGSEYSTIQAAINAAVADGHGAATYGGVLIEVYPLSYGEAVVIPETLSYWHLVGLGEGGSAGPFTSSLTVNVRNGDSDFSVTGFGLGTLTVNQPAGSSPVNYGNFHDVWVFGNATITGPDLRVLAQGLHLYGSTSTLVANCSSFRLYESELLAPDIAHSVTVSDTGYLSNNLLRNCRCVVSGSTVGVFGNTFLGYRAPQALEDATTDFSYIFGNTFFSDIVGTLPVAKTGASVTRHGGNTFVRAAFPHFTVTAGQLQNTPVNGVLNVAGSATVTRTDLAGVDTLTVAKTDGGGAISVPALADAPIGTKITVKDRDGNATASPITVDVDGGGAIDGAPSVSLSTDFQSVTVQAGSTGWMVI